MGVSHDHATNVPLVLDTTSGSITPKFHVVFDDWFATVTSTADKLPNFNSKEWMNMFGDSTFQYNATESSDPQPNLQPDPQWKQDQKLAQ